MTVLNSTDLVVGRRRSERLDAVGRGGLPCVAAVAHVEEDLVVLFGVARGGREHAPANGWR